MKLDLSNSKHKRASVSPNPDREWLSEWFFFFRHAYFQDILDNLQFGLSHTDCDPDWSWQMPNGEEKLQTYSVSLFLCAYTPVCVCVYMRDMGTCVRA